MNKILVTPRSVTREGHPLLSRLSEAGFEVVLSSPGKQPGEDELLELLPACVGYLAGVEKISARVLEGADSLKVISRNGAGIDNIDLVAAKTLGIKVVNAPGANTRGVAELTFGHILGLARRVSLSDAYMKRGQWERRKGTELEEKTLGVIGCGNIGKQVVGFGLAFDMRVLAFDPCRDDRFRPRGDFRYCELDELLKDSDFVSLHCPGQKEAVIGAEAISKMKEGVYIINTARGELMDEEAVKAGLASGKIRGVSVDAYGQEPPEDWELVKNSNVLATPHIGGFTAESVYRAVEAAVDNLLKELR